MNRSGAGPRIVIAATEGRAEQIAETLKGAEVELIPFPTVRIEPPRDLAPLDAALRRWASYDWVVFTSTNGVDAVAARARKLHLDLTRPPRIAAVGPATKAAVEERGLSVDALPHEYVTDAIAEVLGRVEGLRILLPRSNLARASLADELRTRRAAVDDVVAYMARPTSPDATRLSMAARIDWVTFTSASAVENFVGFLPDDVMESLRSHARAACIGPITAEAARRSGFRVGIVARDHTVPGLCRELMEAIARG